MSEVVVNSRPVFVCCVKSVAYFNLFIQMLSHRITMWLSLQIISVAITTAVLADIEEKSLNTTRRLFNQHSTHLQHQQNSASFLFPIQPYYHADIRNYDNFVPNSQPSYYHQSYQQQNYGNKYNTQINYRAGDNQYPLTNYQQTFHSYPQTSYPQQTYNPYPQTSYPQQTYNLYPQTQNPQQTYNPYPQTQTPQQTYNTYPQTQTPQQTYNPYPRTSYPQQTYNPYPRTSYPQQTYNPYPQTHNPQQTYNPQTGQDHNNQIYFSQDTQTTQAQKQRVYELCKPTLAKRYANQIRAAKSLRFAFELTQELTSYSDDFMPPKSSVEIIGLHGLSFSLFNEVLSKADDSKEMNTYETFVSSLRLALESVKEDLMEHKVSNAEEVFSKVEALLADAWATTEATLRMFNSGEEFKPLPPDIAQGDGTLDFSFHEQLPPPMYAFVPLGERSNVPHKYQASEYCYTEQ